jgi:CDGSH-type Zn-finger protein
MDKPKIADKRPAVLELAAGKYAYCTCGLSAKQPFCDGAHAGTSFRPQIFELAEAGKVAVCQCKHTKGAPFCDGAHRDLD